MEPEYQSQEGMRAEMEAWLRVFREDMKDRVSERVPMYLHSVDFEHSSYVVYIDPTPWMADRTGGMGNGAFSVAMDQTMGILGLYITHRRMTPTITLQMSLLRPIPLDRRLYIKAELLGTDGTKLDMRATAWSDGYQGEPVCSAVGIYYGGGPSQMSNGRG